MKSPSRTKGFGRGNRGRKRGPDTENPFAAFEQDSAADDRPGPGSIPPTWPTVSRARVELRAASVGRGRSAPRHAVRRVLVLGILFCVVMPVVPVALLRFVPPPASAMMVKRWVALKLGVPSSKTRTRMLLLLGPCASLGVQVKMPVAGSTLAPLRGESNS